MSGALATSGGTALWYVARAGGVVTLVFLTASVLVGILTSFRWSSPAWPRFAVELVHRNVSLLVVVFLGIHVSTMLLDAFAPIRIVDTFVPFVSAYRPIWLGLGALGLDLVVALVVTSLLRRRIGYTGWRIVHWLAYACWPVAVVHGLGTGSDTTSGLVLGLTVACVVSVLLASGARIVVGLRAQPALRAGALVVLVVAPVVLAVWLVSGPLGPGWARKAGTPEQLLSAASANAAAEPVVVPGAIPAAGFDGRFAGTIQQGLPDARREMTVVLVGNLSGGATGRLEVELLGVPDAGGALRAGSGTVTLTGAAGDRWTGTFEAIERDRISSTVVNVTGSALELEVRLTQLDRTAGQVAGTVAATKSTTRRGRRPTGDGVG